VVGEVLFDETLAPERPTDAVVDLCCETEDPGTVAVEWSEPEVVGAPFPGETADPVGPDVDVTVDVVVELARFAALAK
jgi:hypothetical protein